MEFIIDTWNQIIIQPMINTLVLLYSWLFLDFGIAIIAFTLIVRVILIPLTVKQSRQIKAMTALQPKMKEIQEKHKGDRQRASRETMALYKEQGVNPLGCLGPMFIQFPIWIGLYQAILQTVPSKPESLVGLSQHLYDWLPQVHSVIPIDSSFLWMDLAAPDPSPVVMPILVGASMWVMQKMTTMPTADERQASTNRIMLWMMPAMFGFFTLNFPSGLALYWVVSNVVGVVIQGFVTGWDPILKLLKFNRQEEAQADVTPVTAASIALLPSRRRTMNEIEITGRTVEEAIEVALKELDADRSDVEIDVVSRGKAGLLGIGSEPAKVHVKLLDSPPETVTVASEVIDSLISLMDAEVILTLKQMHNDDLDGPIFEIEGDDAGLLIGRKGETLKTFQFLVRYIVSQRLDDRVNLMIDVEGYQERRRQSLANMARRVARRVTDTGQPITLEPMPSNERRIVHLTLSNHPKVTTESTGAGSTSKSSSC